MKPFYLTFFCTISIIALLSGCSKKKEEPAPQAATPPTNADPAATATPAAQIDAANALAATDAALKAKQYDQAVANLLKLQQQRNLTEQQAQALRDRQLRVQRDLAGAVASGDPKAKAAAEMLRAANAHR